MREILAKSVLRKITNFQFPIVNAWRIIMKETVLFRVAALEDRTMVKGIHVGESHTYIRKNTISDQKHVPLGKLAVCPLGSVAQDPRTHHQEITTRSVCRAWRGNEGTGKHSSPSLINFGRLFSVNIFACRRGGGLQPLPYRTVHTRDDPGASIFRSNADTFRQTSFSYSLRNIRPVN